MRAWHLGDGSPAWSAETDHEGAIVDVAAVGERAVTAGDDATVRWWRLGEGENAAPTPDPVGAVALGRVGSNHVTAAFLLAATPTSSTSGRSGAVRSERCGWVAGR